MYKASVFLFFLVLFSCPSRETIGQVTGIESRPANETNTKVKRLVHEGIELTDAGQLPQAVLAFEEAIRLDPDYADAHAALGRAYFKMRQWRRAVDYLHRAAALNTKQRQATNGSQQQSAATNPNANGAQKQQEPETATPKDSPSVRPRVAGPPPSGQTVKSESPEVKSQSVASEVSRPATQTSSSPPIKLDTVEVPQRTSPEVEKTTSEVLPLKSEAASVPEQKQEPAGDRVSMSASPVSPNPESPGVSPIPLKPSNEDVSLTKIYRVGPGDVLDVRINEAEPRQSTLFTVTPAGQLEHPILAEPLSVSALTTEEIETKIQDELKKRALIDNPQVTVGVRDYASHSILVTGLVKDSGTKFLRREAIPLYVVVADADPLPEAAKVTVLRSEQNQMYEIDLTKVADMSLLVRPGDVINLQRNETQFIYVGGEVKAPGEKIFRRGITLTQAILSAGGMTPKSKVAEIDRDDGKGFLVKTSFKLDDIQTGKIMDPLLRPGDRITIQR